MEENLKPENPNAFPFLEQHGDLETWSTYEGMTLRDYFAAKAMQGSVICEGPEFPNPESIAKWSYAVADAMLKNRKCLVS